MNNTLKFCYIGLLDLILPPICVDAAPRKIKSFQLLTKICYKHRLFVPYKLLILLGCVLFIWLDMYSAYMKGQKRLIMKNYTTKKHLVAQCCVDGSKKYVLPLRQCEKSLPLANFKKSYFHLSQQLHNFCPLVQVMQHATETTLLNTLSLTQRGIHSVSMGQACVQQTTITFPQPHVCTSQCNSCLEFL